MNIKAMTAAIGAAGMLAGLGIDYSGICIRQGYPAVTGATGQ